MISIDNDFIFNQDFEFQELLNILTTLTLSYDQNKKMRFNTKHCCYTKAFKKPNDLFILNKFK